MRILIDREIYEQFTEPYLVNAKSLLWIATANIKGTMIRYRDRFASIADVFAAIIDQGAAIRIIHSELPSLAFQKRYEALDSEGRLSAGLEFLHCIRMHSKIFVVDETAALVGSANLTGAGVGAKAANRRNFEVGFLFEGEREVRPFMNYFDYIWMGGHCPDCGRRDICPAPPA
jgi:phosphatidylserine/phosphatidylglycerophosphate/cardiolipin synthase-like enzyme